MGAVSYRELSVLLLAAAAAAVPCYTSLLSYGWVWVERLLQWWNG